MSRDELVYKVERLRSFLLYLMEHMDDEEIVNQYGERRVLEMKARTLEVLSAAVKLKGKVVE